jgi:MFS family permease
MNSRNIFRSIASYNINMVIKILVLSDFLIFAAYQLFTPIFAIFISEKIGGNLEVIGISMGIYLFSKALFELPVGIFIDQSKSEKDDLYASIFGTMLVGMVYLAYVFIDSVGQLYILQALLGLGGAIAYPGWYSIFTKHIDKGKEGFEWSLYDVLLGIGMAAAATLGGFIASIYSFNTLFILVAVVTFVGALLLFLIRNKIYKK